MSESEMPLFCYCLEVQDRELRIFVSHDGHIHWEDYQEARRNRNPDDRYLELDTVFGSQRARKLLTTETTEYTISFKLESGLFSEVKRAAARLDADKWNQDDEVELDKKLLPLFWSEVNPYLNNPLTQ